MLCGCCICLGAAIALGVDGRWVQPQHFAGLCAARAWLLATGFSMAYGALFTKVWRVHRHTTKPKVDTKVRNKKYNKFSKDVKRRSSECYFIFSISFELFLRPFSTRSINKSNILTSLCIVTSDCKHDITYVIISDSTAICIKYSYYDNLVLFIYELIFVLETYARLEALYDGRWIVGGGCRFADGLADTWPIAAASRNICARSTPTPRWWRPYPPRTGALRKWT